MTGPCNERLIGPVESLDDCILAYPNPSAGVFTLKNQSSAAYLYIMDVLGNIVFETGEVVQAGEMEIDLSSFPKGIYFLKVIESRGQEKVERIVIQ